MLLLLAACLPVPWIAPPATVDVGVAGASPPPLGDMYAPAESIAVYPRVVVSARPLALFEDRRERRVDPHAGFIAELRGDERDALGGTAGVDLRLWQEPWGDNWRSVAGPTFAIDVLADDRPGGTAIVPGARAGIRWEATAWTDDSGAGFDSSGGYVGAAYGEAGLGAYADVGVRLYPEGPGWQVSVGVTLQSPATAGVALVPVPIF